jgi:hypothetical protein
MIPRCAKRSRRVGVGSNVLKSIPALTERLRSRFEGGMVGDISYPDYETRMAILKNKSQEKGVSFPEDILEYIATNIQFLLYPVISIGFIITTVGEYFIASSYVNNELIDLLDVEKEVI